MRTITVTNWKGGVGKTATVVNLAVALAQRNRTVLVIDGDQNNRATKVLGVTLADIDPTDPQARLARAQESLLGALLGWQPLVQVVRRTSFPNVFAVPSTPDVGAVNYRDFVHLAERERQRRRKLGESAGVVEVDLDLSEMALREELDGLPPQMYDYVLIDTPGGDTPITRLALLAADEVIIPFSPSTDDWDALGSTFAAVAGEQNQHDGRPELLGLLPVKMPRSGLPAWLQDFPGINQFPMLSPIRESNYLRSITDRAEPTERVVVAFRPNSLAARGYHMLAAEVDLGIDEARRQAAAANPNGAAAEEEQPQDDLPATDTSPATPQA